MIYTQSDNIQRKEIPDAWQKKSVQIQYVKCIQTHWSLRNSILCSSHWHSLLRNDQQTE